MLHIGRIALSTHTMNTDEIGYRIAHTLQCFCEKNKIQARQIKGIIFSQTDDITTWNPAGLLRKETDLYSKVALFCTKEPTYEHATLQEGIRMAVFFQKRTLFSYTPIPVYMYGAEHLRTDLN